MEHEHPPHGHYLVVFVALCILTAISWLTDIIHIPSRAVTAVIVLAVSTAKALCVMGYFMHLRFERNWKYVLLAPTIILACGIPLALLPDLGVHYYTVTAPQYEQVWDRDLGNAVNSIVSNEDKSAPLSDETIAEKLQRDYGLDVSAAVVARFRNSQDIPTAEQRKTEE